MLRRAFVGSLAVVGSLACRPGLLRAEDSPTDFGAVIAKGVAFLEKQQGADGSYASKATTPGITALVATALLRNGRAASDPLVAKSLAYLETLVQPDGGIYKPGSRLKNYETCLAIVCLSEANKDGKYDKLLQGAEKYIKGEQWDEADGKTQADFNYGGSGYGGDSPPDLSNTQFFLEALQATGNDENSEAVKRALIFVSRCQNLETEFNTAPPAAKNPDGGFYYSVATDSSAAGKTDEGGLRSYGSMTYAGLKSMIFAGVKRDDPRVKAAVKWAQKNYSLTSNPGMGDAGLFYYYHTLAKAFSSLEEDVFEDASGQKHDWRKELIAELGSRQSEDGSWVNKNNKWMEGDSTMVTGFALLTLSYCKPKK